MKLAIDLRENQAVIVDSLQRINDHLQKGETDKAKADVTRLLEELQNQMVSLPRQMYDVPESFFGKVVYTIRHWRLLWEDWGVQVALSRVRLRRALKGETH